MKKQIFSIPRSIFRTSLGALLLLALFAVAAAPKAEASTSAGTLLTDAVTVNYKDSGNIAQTPVTASITVTVNLVGSVAWGTAPTAQDAGSGLALPSAYTITLHNTGNGSDTFTIVDGTTLGSGLGAGSFTIATSPATLFGTITSGVGAFAAGVTTIPVSNLTVADATAGKTVQIGSHTYTIASGSDSTHLKVSTDATADATGAGIQIGEVYTVTYNGTAGTLTAGTANADYTHSLTATGTSQNSNAAATATSATWLTHVHGPSLTVTKYVRNVLNANGNSGAAGSTPLYTSTYYTSGVKGNPGDTLEYVVIVKNTATATSGSATAVVFDDTFPSYTNYVAGQTMVDKATGSLVALSPDTEACGQGSGIFNTDTCGGANPTKIRFYLGTGGVEGALWNNGTGGTIPGGNNTAATWGILYRVTIQ